LDCPDLTKNELSIMEILWRENRPLLGTEIVELCENKSWKASSLHILLGSMLDKGAIVVDGFVKRGKHYSRAFSPTVSHADYLEYFISHSALSNEFMVKNLLQKIIESDDISDETLGELENMIREKREG